VGFFAGHRGWKSRSQTFRGRTLAECRRASGIEARLVTVGLVSNGFSIADCNDPGQLDVVGFDTATPQLIADFARAAPSDTGAPRGALPEEGEPDVPPVPGPFRGPVVPGQALGEGDRAARPPRGPERPAAAEAGTRPASRGMNRTPKRQVLQVAKLGNM
jgi:hypothetical protein